ncbi:uncharacterized protein EHS24_009608 [Apiotrichum porosum]|uniref:F-box domain-containing protein n=1 Tax=Apiotrichum porosum TaxID=105984 RepID=A0A427XM48_9TREE|nr:uncharacterized protein EHS24_009608 [Apiotrichum porosum]RSH79940.1 hypothetical protein EHS24_009608 [Apiotrichum porosum]
MPPTTRSRTRQLALKKTRNEGRRTRKITVTIDFKYFPHIIDGIIAASDWNTLMALRQTCRSLCTAVDTRMCYHVVLDIEEEGYEPRFISPYGRIPVLQDCLSNWHVAQPGREASRHRAFTALSKTRLLEIHCPRSFLECMEPKSENDYSPTPFDYLQSISYHDEETWTYLEPELGLKASTVVVFGKIAYRAWFDEDERENRFMAKVLPMDQIDCGTRKLVINVLGDILETVELDDDPFDDANIIPSELPELVLIFTNCIHLDDSEHESWNWPIDGIDRREWVLHVVFTVFKFQPTSHVTIVDLADVEYDWMFDDMTRNPSDPFPHKTALTNELHKIANTVESIWDPTAANRDLFQRVRLAIDSIDFITMDEYAERLEPGELEWETEDRLYQ